MKTLRPMSEAPFNKEILALSKSGGNFHPVVQNNNLKRWRMRWNTDYSQHETDYLGWIPMPTLQSEETGELDLRKMLERISAICDANLETTRAICLVEIKRICDEVVNE